MGRRKGTGALPLDRRLVQVYTAVLYNAHLKGFVTGKIYTGKLKTVCAPGLNCYSCPGAVAACPLGALQNAVAASAKRPAFYAVGLLLLFGLLFGRVICGWACPMGFLQELLYKIPLGKLKKSRATRVLSRLKYLLLAVFVIAVPLWYGLKDAALPAFCKYICPAGTLEGALGLLLHPANGELRSLAGGLLIFKLAVAAAVLLAAVCVFRPFCRFACPLGALYGLLAKVALFGVKVDETRCTDCGRCVKICPADIKRVGDAECVHCGRCMETCPEQAIRFGAGGVTLAGPAFAAHKREEADRAE